MRDAQTKERARELRRAGASLREIGKVVGVSHVTVREWTLGEPVGGPADSGGKDVADDVRGTASGNDAEPTADARRAHIYVVWTCYDRQVTRRRWSSGF